jgi:hypothetical protein
MLRISAKGSASARGRTVVVGMVAAMIGVVLSIPSAVAAPAPRWTTVPVQTPAGVASANSIGALFGNMACLAASECWSAGTGFSKSGANVPFIEHWTGHRFGLVKTPVRHAYLQGLACVTANDCWLAGGAGTASYGLDAQFVPLLEHWNGKRWARAKVPDRAGVDNELADVSCVSKSSCYAVGWTSTTTHARALIEHWTGKHWTVVADTHIRGQKFARLDGIDCIRHSVCTVVGQEQATTSSAPRAFGERGIKTRWSVVSMPAPASPNNDTELYGLSCPTSHDCMATGSAYYWPGGGYDPGEPIAEHWNGKHWSLISPKLSEPTSGGDVPVTTLGDISCASAKLCWAVGATAGITGHSPAVTARWNGSKFSLGHNANPTSHDQLDAVDCTRATRCLAIGYDQDKTSALHALAEKLS